MSQLIAKRKTLLFMAAFVVFSAALQFAKIDFIYNRSLLFIEPWRWWTAHWVHLGWRHYALNMLAFMFIAVIFPRVSKHSLTFVLLVFPPFLSLGLYLFYPSVYGYAGLSGVLHGLYAFVAIQHLTCKISRERQFAWLVLGCTIIKVLWEKWLGHTETEQIIKVPVLIESHQIGLVIGLVMGVVFLIFSFWSNTRGTKTLVE